MVTSLKLEYVELKSWGSLLTNGKKGNSDVKNIVEEEEEEEDVIYFAVLYCTVRCYTVSKYVTFESSDFIELNKI